MSLKVTVKPIAQKAFNIHEVKDGWYKVDQTNRHPVNSDDPVPLYEVGDVLFLATGHIVNMTRSTVEPLWDDNKGGGYINVVAVCESTITISITNGSAPEWTDKEKRASRRK